MEGEGAKGGIRVKEESRFLGKRKELSVTNRNVAQSMPSKDGTRIIDWKKWSRRGKVRHLTGGVIGVGTKKTPVEEMINERNRCKGGIEGK